MKVFHRTLSCLIHYNCDLNLVINYIVSHTFYLVSQWTHTLCVKYFLRVWCILSRVSHAKISDLTTTNKTILPLDHHHILRYRTLESRQVEHTSLPVTTVNRLHDV